MPTRCKQNRAGPKKIAVDGPTLSKDLRFRHQRDIWGPFTSYLKGVAAVDEVAGNRENRYLGRNCNFIVISANQVTNACVSKDAIHRSRFALQRPTSIQCQGRSSDRRAATFAISPKRRSRTLCSIGLPVRTRVVLILASLPGQRRNGRGRIPTSIPASSLEMRTVSRGATVSTVALHNCHQSGD